MGFHEISVKFQGFAIWNIVHNRMPWKRFIIVIDMSLVFEFYSRLWFHVAAASCEVSVSPKSSRSFPNSSESSRILWNFHKLYGFCPTHPNFAKSFRIFLSLELSKTKNNQILASHPIYFQGSHAEVFAKLKWGSIWTCIAGLVPCSVSVIGCDWKSLTAW